MSMTKRFSFVLALLLVFSMPATLLANPVTQMPESATYTMEARMNLGLTLPAELMEGELAALLPFLMQDINISARGTMVMDTETFQTMHFHTEGALTAGGIFYIPFAMWMDMDFSRPNAPVYRIIMEVPELLQALMPVPELARQFWVLDYALLFEEDPTLMDMMSMDAFMDIEAIVGLLPESEAMGNNVYRMTWNDAQFTEFMVDIFDLTVNSILGGGLIQAQIEAEFGTQEFSEEELEELVYMVQATLLAELEGLYGLLRNVTFLGGDWVTYYGLNEAGYTVFEESSAQFVFDLQEWATALVTFFPELAQEFALADIPEIVITLDLEYVAEFENINTATPVSLPILTPQNSVDLTALLLEL
jgi:hypothetical protein